MDNLLEKIKSLGYEIIKSDSLYQKTNSGIIYHLYIKNTNTNQTGHIYAGEKPMYLLGGYKPKDQAEAEEMVKAGKGIKVLTSDVYKQYYQMDEEMYCMFINGYDLKTKAVLDEIKNRIGLLRYTSCANSSMSENGEFTPAPETSKKMPVFYNGSEVEYWQLDNGEWIAQFGFWYEIDDFAVTKFYFDKEPTDVMIRAAYGVSEVEINFKTGFTKKAERTLEDLVHFVKQHWMNK